MKKITKHFLVTSLSTTMILSQGLGVSSQALAIDTTTNTTLSDNKVYTLQLVGSGWTKEDAENYFATYVQKNVQVTEHNGQKVIAINISGDSPFDPDNVFYAGSQLAELSADKKTAYVPLSAIVNQQVDIDFDVVGVDYSTKHLRGQLTFLSDNEQPTSTPSTTETVSESTSEPISESTTVVASTKNGPLHLTSTGNRATDYQTYFDKYIDVNVTPVMINGEQVIPVKINSDTVTFDEESLFYSSENTVPQLSEDRKIAYIPVTQFKDNKVEIDFRLSIPGEYATFIRGDLFYDQVPQTSEVESTTTTSSALSIVLPNETLTASAGFAIDVWQDVVIKDNDVVTPRSELAKSYVTIMKNNETLSKTEATELMRTPVEGSYQVTYHVEKNGQTQEKTVPLVVTASHVTYDKSSTQPLADGVYTITAKAQRIDSPENESILLNFFDPRVKLEVVNGEYIVTFLNTGLGKSVIDFSLSVPTYKDYSDNTLSQDYYPRNKTTIKHVNSEEFNTYTFKMNSIEDIRQVGVLYTHRGGIEELVGHYDRYKMAFLTFNLDDIKQGWHGFQEEENTKNGETVLQNALVREGLDLNNNGFVTADELAQAQGEVDLSNYQLSDVSFLKNLGAGVTTLKLMNNAITALPEDFFDNMPNLENIYLNHNSLTTLPSSLSKLSKLQVFKAPYNTISILSPGIFDGSRDTLQEIELENNFLTEIPDAVLSNLTQVDAIDLSNNHLSTLGKQSFMNTDNLSYLNLSNNRLIEVPQQLEQSSKLRTLNMNGNLLSKLDLTRLQTPELQNLKANGNMITDLITGATVALPKLTTFDISSNLLTSFDETPFKTLSEIITLDVALNPFTKQTIVGDRIISPIVSSSIDGEAKSGQINWQISGLTPADYVLWSKASSRLKPIVDKAAYEQYLANLNMSAPEVLTEEGHNFDTLVRLEKQQPDGKFIILEEKQVKQQSLTQGMFNDTSMQPGNVYRVTVQSRSLVLGDYQPRAVIATLVTASAAPQEKVTKVGEGTLNVLKDGTQELSTMNKFINPDINILNIDGKKFVEMTIKNASWWQSFTVDGQEVMQISANNNDDTRVVRFALTDDKTLYPSSVHVVAKVPGFAYDHHYNVQLKVDASVSKVTPEEVTTQPTVTEEVTTQPTVTEEVTTQPAVTEEVTTQPTVTEEVTTQPTVTEEVTTQPTVSEEATTQPAVTEEVTTQSAIEKTTKVITSVENNNRVSNQQVSKAIVSTSKTHKLPKTGLASSSTLAMGLLSLLVAMTLHFRRKQK